MRIHKIFIKALLTISILLSGCAGPGQLFEPTMYGVPQSTWAIMTDGQKQRAIEAYQKEQESRAEEARLQAIRESRRLEQERLDNANEAKRQQQTQLWQTKHQQEHDRRRQQEQRDLDEAKRRSLETYNQEQDRRQQQEQARQQQQDQARQQQQDQVRRQQQEQRDLDEAKRRSLETYKQDQIRRQQQDQVIQQQEQRDLDEAKRRSLETYEQEQVRQQQVSQHSSAAPAASANSWEPNEGQLVKAGELVMQLQRDNGGQRPSNMQMINYLQANMGISAAQAQKIITELGLD